MNPGIMLSNLIIGPLKLLFEVLFSFSNRVLNEGLSIIVLSLAVNILVLPLYRRADAMQEEERLTEERLAPGVKHIKSVFRGDEQMMVLQTYYRQNHYSPLHALKGALPLLLQVPFFIAAYQFLSSLGCLQGTAFGPIRDLGQPDQLLRLGGTAVNVLPVLMTGINLLSGALYTRGAPLKSKIQLLGMALIFLILLYDSPAGLTFYWTLNNVFSLGKNIAVKLLSGRKERKHRSFRIPKLLQGEPHPGTFFLCAVLLALLTGLLIPTAVMASSPQEFVESMKDIHPFWYAVNALLLSSGTFVLWFGVYYMLGTPPMKRGLELAAAVLFGIFLVNYLFFRSGLGTISSVLQYDRPPEFSMARKAVNLLALVPAAILFALLLRKRENWFRGLALTMALAMCGMSARNLWIIRDGTEDAWQVIERNYEGAAEIPVSREGKNVVVIMLDRAISSYLPCILQERPDLAEVFSGFVYYPNTASFGMHTILGAPPLFGGYEYTPSEMNARDSELLRDKHNEALLLLPTLFSGQGARITVFDVPYPGNYTELGDYTLFDALPETNARIIHGQAESNGIWERAEDIRLRNFFCYSLTVTAPTVLFGPLYNMGGYNRARGTPSLFAVKERRQVYADLEAQPTFMAEYDVLKNLGKMTRILEGNQDTLLMMVNCLTHQPTLLQEPEYVPSSGVDNSAYDAAHADRFLAGPLKIHVDSDYQMAHYEVNMAALLMVGDWLEKLKAEGVYDNTRIILVSDHGFWLRQIPEGGLPDGEDVMGYNPLLLVKDFDAQGPVRTDTVFMTNADVPTLALEQVVKDPVNPFTGNPVNSAAKEKTLRISVSHEFQVGKDKGASFPPGRWYALEPGGDTLFDRSRWTLLEETE